MTNEESIGAQNAIQRIAKDIEPHDWAEFHRKAGEISPALKAISFDLIALKQKFTKLNEELEKRDHLS